MPLVNLTRDGEVPGLDLTSTQRVRLYRQAVRAHVPLSRNSVTITWYRSKGVYALYGRDVWHHTDHASRIIHCVFIYALKGLGLGKAPCLQTMTSSPYLVPKYNGRASQAWLTSFH